VRRRNYGLKVKRDHKCDGCCFDMLQVWVGLYTAYLAKLFLFVVVSGGKLRVA